MKLDLSGLKLKKINFIYYKAIWYSVIKGSEMIMKNGKLAIKPDGSNPIHPKKKKKKRQLLHKNAVKLSTIT